MKNKNKIGTETKEKRGATQDIYVCAHILNQEGAGAGAAGEGEIDRSSNALSFKVVCSNFL